ncbi:MAG: aminotransferase class III-fold pyridoxal phosphate-dependent enzyme, partial [Planctomycetota bacterium]|nr:aminotransferase class III-fold pyridoxal phosphate-dependent enzyme [Planctomycetota bacterium]
ALVSALKDQSEKLFFQSNAVPLTIRQEAAQLLVDFAPESIDHVFFVNSGAEANENALRLACRYTHRSTVIAVNGGFHGRTAGAATVTDGSSKWYGFPRTPFDVIRIARDDVDGLSKNMSGDVAAIIVEPVQGIAGAIPLSAEFLQVAREQADKNGALLIFDEVQCGMGRTGHPFAAQYFGVTPDILTSAKGLAGGFPAGALLMKENLASFLSTGDLGSTFGGGPMACALIKAVIDTIHQEALLENVQAVSAYLFTNARIGPVVDVQGVGFLIGLRTSRPAVDVRSELLERNILTGGSADPHIVRLLPPLILTTEHVDVLLTALRAIPS